MKCSNDTKAEHVTGARWHNSGGNSVLLPLVDPVSLFPHQSTRKAYVHCDKTFGFLLDSTV